MTNLFYKIFHLFYPSKIEPIKLKCIKSLYRSTYKRNAFTKNKYYFIVGGYDKFYLVKDNLNREFDFLKPEFDTPQYNINHYFYSFNEYFKTI